MEIGKAIGRLKAPVVHGGFEVVLYEEVFGESQDLLGRFVGVPFSLGGKEGVLIGQVEDFLVESSLGENPEHFLGLGEKEERAERLVSVGGRIVLKCKAVSAFSAGKRKRLSFSLPPMKEAYLVSDEFLEGIFSQVEGLFSLGRFYGAGVRHWTYLRDFSALGEAYHTLVAGQTGSGKSTLVQMLLLGYARASREMNFFILDPVGEFSRAFRGKAGGHFQLDLRWLWGELGRKAPQLYGLNNLALGRWEILEALLVEEKVFAKLGMRSGEHRQDAVSLLVEKLKGRDVPLSKLDEAWPVVQGIVKDPGFLRLLYASPDSRNRVAEILEDEDYLRGFQEAFLGVARLFSRQGRTPIPDLVSRLLSERGQTTVVDLSELDWGDPVKYLLIGEILHQLYRKALERYKRTGRADFNTLVVLDEAHRVAPPDKYLEGEHARKTKGDLVRAFAETRKFGLGWLVISTRLSLLDRKLFEHVRVKLLGYGLGVGEDGELIRENYGRGFLNLYNTLPDPVDPLTERTHTFAMEGPITLLSKGVPELVEIYNDPEEFLRANGLKMARRESWLLEWKGGAR